MSRWNKSDHGFWLMGIRAFIPHEKQKKNFFDYRKLKCPFSKYCMLTTHEIGEYVFFLINLKKWVLTYLLTCQRVEVSVLTISISIMRVLTKFLTEQVNKSLLTTSLLIFTMKQLDTSTSSPEERRDAGDVSPLPLVCIDFMQEQP